MIVELGHFSLILALVISLMTVCAGVYGNLTESTQWQRACKVGALLQACCVSFSFLALIYAFVTKDFSVQYVVQHANKDLPLIYRICATWGGHEGSLLLWVLFLSLWSSLVTLRQGAMPLAYLSKVLSTLGAIAAGFISLSLFTSNPFVRYLPFTPPNGLDLNPLLQDPGLIIHPPMLYLGYVGFAVAFAFAVATMFTRDMDHRWATWVRPWVLAAWLFLTVGITLGSWWAYYELGWGGWWFWDPVENASLMPWLVGGALIHALVLLEKRRMAHNWVLLLSLLAFSLSMVGTFLVRSGVITSVHAFATDPERGVFILKLLALLVGGALLLYAFRSNKNQPSNKFSLLSRETALLLNNLLLCAMAFTVLLGTLYPMILDALQLGKISVGPPYFNLLISPMVLAMCCFMLLSTAVRWQGMRFKSLCKVYWLPALLTALILAVIIFQYRAHLNFWLLMAVALALFAAIVTLTDIFRQHWQWRRVGMHLAHLGVITTFVGVVVTSQFSIEQDLRVEINDTVKVGQYAYHFDGIKHISGPNYQAVQGNFSVSGRGLHAQLHPEKRFYENQAMPMTETAIRPGLIRDLYIALGEPLNDHAWSVRIYDKPFVRFLWLGGLMMAFGAILTMLARRQLHVE